MRHLDLFSGIGGFSLALDNVYGKENIKHTFCDNDDFCQEVLRKHWPEAEIFGDIRTLTNAEFARAGMEVQNSSRQKRRDTKTSSSKVVRQGNGSRDAERINTSPRTFLLTGGFPCQPFSHAGRRKGTDDDRHLWPEMLRVIREFQPKWVVAENVRGLLNIEGGLVFETVCSDLEAIGYEVQSFVIPACAVNAPHRRDRVWIVGHARSTRTGEQNSGVHRREPKEEGGERKDFRNGTHSAVSDAQNPQRERRRRRRDGNTARDNREVQAPRPDAGRDRWQEPWLAAATRLCRMDDGLPRRLDRNPRLKALGNAIVPQIAVEIFKAIKAYEELIWTGNYYSKK